jgi:Zn-dependent protease
MFFDAAFIKELLLRLATWVPVFVLAICIHEAAHAWAAWKLGDPTPVVQGRLTLDPRAHFDPLGALMFLLAMFSGVGFGWAKPVQVNPLNFRHMNRDMALVAAAGPASNFLQAFFWTAFLAFIVSLANLLPPSLRWLIAPILTFLAQMGSAGILVNLGLAFFNLIPIPPLDGSRILRMFLPLELKWQMDMWERTGLGFLTLLVLLYVGALNFIWAPVREIARWLFHLAGV